MLVLCFLLVGLVAHSVVELANLVAMWIDNASKYLLRIGENACLIFDSFKPQRKERV